MTSDQVEDVYALSPMQTGMLFHTLYASEYTAYLDQQAYALKGDLDIPAFKRAWEYLLERHGILRTSFHWEGLEEPLQVVHPKVELPLEQHDWTHLPATEQRAALTALLQADRDKRVDLSEPPLMRITLIRTGPAEWQYVWTLHHILMDRWSVTQVQNEFKAAYEALSNGRRISLPPLRPYRDYIRWLRQQNPERAETYWRGRMAGFTSPTVLPIDRTPGVLTSKGRSEHKIIRLTAQTSSALTALARQYRVTLSTVVQAAWALLLSHHSGEADVLFGATVSGRPATLPGVETIVGLFINTLPVRIRVDLSVRVGDWLQQLQAEAVEMRQYEHNSLVQIQGWSDVPRGRPLFDSLVVVQNHPTAGATASNGAARSQEALPAREGLQARSLAFESSVDVPLYITVSPEHEIRFIMHYDATRYAEDDIARLLDHLRALMEGIASDPLQRIADLSLLTPPERHQLLEEWNHTEAPAPETRCVHQLFEEQAAKSPDAVAVVLEGQTLTYAALNRRANTLAHVLRQQGIGPDTLVGLQMERSLAMGVALLAILKAGGAYLPLDPANPPERLRAILEDVKPALVLTDTRSAGRFADTGCKVLCLDGEPTLWEAESDASPANVTTPEDLAYVMFTSGSTGIPKGVAVPHRAITRLVKSPNFCHLGPEEVFLQFAPLAFDASTLEIWGCWLNGGKLVLFAEQTPSLEDLGRTIHDNGITTLWLTAGLFHPMVEAHLDALQGVRQLLAGGDVLSPVHVVQALQGLPSCRLINGYGPTENTTLPAAIRSRPTRRRARAFPSDALSAIRRSTSSTVTCARRHRELQANSIRAARAWRGVIRTVRS